MCLGSKKSNNTAPAAAPAPAPAPEIPVSPTSPTVNPDTGSGPMQAPVRTTSTDTGLTIPT